MARTTVLLALTVLAGTACGPRDGKDGPVETYVGTVDGSDAVVAIAIQSDGDVIGYSCGGPADLDVMTTWVSGPRSGDGFELERGSGTISGTIGEGSITESWTSTKSGRSPRL